MRDCALNNSNKQVKLKRFRAKTGILTPFAIELVFCFKIITFYILDPAEYNTKL